MHAVMPRSYPREAALPAFHCHTQTQSDFTHNHMADITVAGAGAHIEPQHPMYRRAMDCTQTELHVRAGARSMINQHTQPLHAVVWC